MPKPPSAAQPTNEQQQLRSFQGEREKTNLGGKDGRVV